MADQFKSPGLYVQLNTPSALVPSSGGGGGGGGDPGTGLMEDDRWTLGPPKSTPVLQNNITIVFVNNGQDQDHIISGIGGPTISVEDDRWWLGSLRIKSTESLITAVAPNQDQDVVSSGALPLTIWLWGQSNLGGQDSAANFTGGNTSLTAAGPAGCLVMAQDTIAQDPTTWRYFGAFGDGGGNGSLTPPATYGTASPHRSETPGFTDGVGPELTMVRDIVAGSTGITQVAKFAIAGGSVTTHMGPAAVFPSTGPTYWNQALTFLVQNSSANCVGIIHYQGESDCPNTTLANAYYAATASVFSGLRANTQSGNAPIIVALLVAGSTPSGMPQLAIVRAAQQLLVDSIPWCTLVSNDDGTLITDQIHLNADSQATAGHRYVTALTAALVTTTLSGSLTDSPDPVVTSSALTYTVSLTNSGANSASNICAQITLPTGVVFGSSSGTGWTITQVSQVIFCKRATMVVGAAPVITLNCTSPSSFGSGSITATMSVVSSNVATALTASQTTTLQNPTVFKDTIQDVWVPQTPAQFTTLGLDPPNWALYTCQEGSGNLVDQTGNGNIMAPSGSPTYSASSANWTLNGVTWADLGGSFSCSTYPNPALTSAMIMMMYEIAAGPAGTRDMIACYTSTFTVRVTATPRFGAHLGASAPLGTVSPVGSGILCLQFNKTGSAAALYTMGDKIIPTFASQTSSVLKIGGGNVCIIRWIAGWTGSNAEVSSATIKSSMTTLGNGHWAFPWS